MYLNVTEKKMTKEIMQIIGAELKRRRLMKGKVLRFMNVDVQLVIAQKLKTEK